MPYPFVHESLKLKERKEEARNPATFFFISRKKVTMVNSAKYFRFRSMEVFKTKKSQTFSFSFLPSLSTLINKWHHLLSLFSVEASLDCQQRITYLVWLLNFVFAYWKLVIVWVDGLKANMSATMYYSKPDHVLFVLKV